MAKNVESIICRGLNLEVLMSKVHIVDATDNLVGYKERDLINYEKDIYRSTALWVFNPNREVLLAQRKLTKARQPGKWGPSVAGTVEEGEDYDSNIKKEALEEIGLKGYSLRKLQKVETIDSVHQFTQWYAVEVDLPLSYFVPQPEEVEALDWIAIEKLNKDYDAHPDKYVASMGRCLEVINEVFV